MHSVSRYDLEAPAVTPARASTLDRLLQCAGARTVEVRSRGFLFHQGDACRGIYYLQSGMASLQRVDDQGAFIIFGLIKPGGFFSWSDVLGRGLHRNSAQAVGVAKATFVPREAFLEAMRRDPQAFSDTMEQASREMQDYEDTIFRLCTADVPERLYWTLRRLAGAERSHGKAIEFKSPVLKRELAAMIGTSPEGISRGIRRLEELNIARFTGRTIWLNLQAA